MPDRFSRFDVYWIQTDKQTDRQAKFIYRYAFALHSTKLVKMQLILRSLPTTLKQRTVI